jgi:nucleotide-binding universal stress UspA family protein
MPVKLPDTVVRRVAVVLGTSGSGQQLLNFLQPLLGINTEINLQGVFIEDDELQRAAALPFSKELCRLTLSVREIQSARFERTIALQTRTAHRAIAALAQRMGVSHSFRKVRGSTISLLRETAHSADITVFEPLRIFAASPIAPPVHTSRPQQRIVVAVENPATAAETLIAAALLAEGEMHRVSVLLTTATATGLAALDHLISDLLPANPARILLLPNSGIQNLITTARAERADMLVLGASEELLKPESLRLFIEQLRCPICLVRQWDGKI